MKRISAALLLVDSSGMAQEVGIKKQPTYTAIDFSHDRWKQKTTQNWQSEGKRRKPRIK